MKNVMLKRCLVIILSVILSVLVVACGGATSKESGAGEKAGNADKKITLRFSWWGGDERHEATLKVMENYTAKNPNVVFEGEYGGFDGYLEKIITQLAADTAPDIIQIDYAYLEPFWGQMDKFQDFNQTEIIDTSGFSADMLEGISAPTGELIGLPTGLNSTSLYANKTVADKYGIDLTKQYTWDKVMADGIAIHKQDPDAYLLYPTTINRYIFEPYLFNQTGKKLVEDDYTLGFDRESVKNTLQYISDLYENGVMVPLDQTIEVTSPWEYTGWLEDKVMMSPDFSSGFDPAKASLEEGELACLMPMGDSEAENTGIMLRPTNMLSVNAKSKNREEALKFVDYFFNDPEAIDILGLVRAVPPTTKALDRMVEVGKLDSGLKATVDWAKEHKGGKGQNIISTNLEIETIENDVLAALYYGDLTVDEAADEFMKLMTEKVQELQEIAAKK